MPRNMLQTLIRNLLSLDFALSKRDLGAILIAAGLVGVLGTLGIELLRARATEIGALQQLAIGLSLLAALIGASLLPLGDRAA